MTSDAPVLDPSRAAKTLAAQAVGRHLAELVRLSNDLHDHPELSFAEYRSSAAVALALADAGFAVTFPAYGLATAFEAVIGEGELVVTICAEYDALPDLGHACGHNVIAATAVGAGVALAHLVGVLGLTLRVLGTPAEERGGGKVLLVERGAFDGVGAAMMVHPAPADALVVNCKASVELEIELNGTSPSLVDDAMTVAQVAIGLARQHLRPGESVAGVVDTRAHASRTRIARYQLRAEALGDLDDLERRVVACFEAGALATGSRLAARRVAPAYGTFVVDEEILERYRVNAEALGRRFAPYPPAVISTDMANVSAVVPSIHPAIGINSWPAMNHTAGFERASIGPSADRAVRDGALALAWTTIDLALDRTERERLVAGQLAGGQK